VKIEINVNIRRPRMDWREFLTSQHQSAAVPISRPIGHNPEGPPRGVHTPRYVQREATEALRRIFKAAQAPHSSADLAAVVYQEQSGVGQRMHIK